MKKKIEDKLMEIVAEESERAMRNEWETVTKWKCGCRISNIDGKIIIESCGELGECYCDSNFSFHDYENGKTLYEFVLQKMKGY